MTKESENAETSGRRKKRSICYFLLSLLQDESYHQVQWTNKEKGEFQMHWMHASSGAWVMNTDAETFRLWAKAKGKLEGRESNYKTWKANFRCAMKSRHELEEIELPEGSPHRKKNLKFWKFTDMELVNKYKDGETFDWNRPKRQSSLRKSVRPLRTRRKKKTTDPAEETESDESESSQQSFDSCEPQCSSTQSISSDTVLQSSYEIEEFSEQQLPINMEDENDFNSYGAGLLQILEQGDTDSVVPNVPLGDHSQHLFPDHQNRSQTGNTLCHQHNQLPSFHQISSSFGVEQHFSENVLLEQDWELFGDEAIAKELKGENSPTRYFDTDSNDLVNSEDPFLYESIYMEL